MLPILYAVFPKEVPRYIDVFGGSGSVLLGKPKSKFEVFNDVDGELINLFHCIRDRFEEFLVELGLFPLNSREGFNIWLKCHDRGVDIEQFADLQLEILDMDQRIALSDTMKQVVRRRTEYPEIREAAAYFMLIRNSYASAGKSFACQPFNIETLFNQLEEMSARIKEVVIERQSFEVLIPHYDRMDSFFYADPPYLNSEYLYDADFGWEQHVLLRNILYGIKGKFLLSQVDCPQIRELYKECDILDFKRIHTKVLWQMLKDKPWLKQVYLCLDSDEAGQNAAKRIAEKLEKHSIKHKILVPKHKDWNEDLIHLRKEQAQWTASQP